MFIDKATVVIKAGDGGKGALSFRHEKFIDRGGPDGGDGGKGGDVVFLASRNQNTLASFRFQKELTAEPGAAGSKQRKHGKNGADLEAFVPVGTVVTTESGEVLADLATDGQKAIIAHGGDGGFGNAHFVSSRRQAPRIAEKGEPGDAFTAQLELKIIADVGLVGLPNAGKSTLLSVISNARPEIANYPFTTLTPNLGVVDIDKQHSLLFADIPGLIEGAAAGKGLGDEFLRHVERTAVLVHLIDAYQSDVATAYQTIQAELKAYKIDLSTRPQLVALSKIEGLDADIVKDQLAQLKTIVPAGTPLMAISAQSKQGIKELLYQTQTMVQAVRNALVAAQTDAEASDIPVISLPDTLDAWSVVKTDGEFTISGAKIERFAARTDFSSEDSLARLRHIMQKMGIIHELRRQGIARGDSICIQKHTFEY